MKYNYKLDFKLNQYQANSSKLLLKYVMQNENVLLDAVCGAGKTEVLLETIKVCLNKKMKIGFACPRKALLIELYTRIKDVFNSEDFGLIYGGYQYKANAQLVFLTTHQLSKYNNEFDILIIDEIDAFPYIDNFKLEKAASNSSKQFIYLSATVPAKYYKMNLKILKIYHRHHLKVMPVPKILKSHKSRYILLIYKIIKIHKHDPMIIYVPTKKTGKKINTLLKIIKQKTAYIDSSSNITKIINEFKNKKYNIIVTTTVLERGITLKDVNVIIYDANAKVFNEKVLIQICGRVGRHFEKTTGEIYYLCNDINDDIYNSIKKIKEINYKITSL
ncbi:helicase-related protein [Mycoplasma sp. P36-A1]|uniref:helicase-related protein n=1 Tax=Mycoplasma sp. P36-A1 TaxID=3252900 RepID=UPI003C2B8F9E